METIRAAQRVQQWLAERADGTEGLSAALSAEGVSAELFAAATDLAQTVLPDTLACGSQLLSDPACSSFRGGLAQGSMDQH
eukprot:4501-Heterococcus_DN1.PRE.3